MSATPTLVTNVKDVAVNIVNADASALKTLLTADASWWTIVSLQVTSDDTSARVLSFYKTITGVDYLIGSVSVATLAGTDGATAVKNVLTDALLAAPIYDANGNKIIHVETGVLIKVKSLTTVTAAKTVTITATALKS